MALVTTDQPDGIDMATVGFESPLEIRPAVRVGTNSATVGIRTIAEASVLNYGSVLAGGANGIGIDADDAGVTNVQIRNAAGGKILGDGTGIVLGSNTLFNAGIITSNGSGVTADVGSNVTNLGAIHGFQFGVLTAGSLTNLGTIQANSIGINFGGASETLINHGIVRGSQFAIGLGIGSTLRNTGTIEGNITVLDGFDATTLQIFNSGTIAGNIELSIGNDRYDGRQGEALGIVQLKDGHDTALGGAGDETFDGGLGNDLLNGGTGIDTAIFDAGVGNKVVNLSLPGAHATGDGTDTLVSIENVITGQGNDQITGNAEANRLDSGEGNDTLTGGAGDDVLIGGGGADTAAFIGATAAFVDLSRLTAQNTGHGLDTLDGIEHLIGTAGNDGFVGNAGNNTLNGQAGNDILTGGLGNDMLIGQAGTDNLIGQGGADTLSGGAGDDLLTGGAGQDSFLFNTLLAQAGVDAISDFVVVDDTIRLKKSVFTALDLGVLDPDAFRLGAVAQDADDRILYNVVTGHLLYDADGSGAGTAVHFATLLTKPAVTFADFLVV